MTETTNDEISPDELMESFRGRSLKSIIAFTVVVHAVLLLGTSVPFLVKSVMGEDTSKMSEQERTEKAMREATASLREIAEANGLNPQDISSQLAGGASRPGKASKPENTKAAGSDPKVIPDEPKSAIEKELDVKAKGPALPEVEDDEEDLFK